MDERPEDRMAEFAAAIRIGTHLVQAGLLFRRKTPEPLPPESGEASRTRIRAEVEREAPRA